MKWFKKKEDLKKEKLLLLLTQAEKEFVVNQSNEECTSQNSIVRKAINRYKMYIESLVN